MKNLALLTTLIGGLGLLPSAGHASSPRELGQVAWRTEWDAAASESRSSGRPLLVLFQEIPGCATCVGFGQGPLSHPLLVEAIETEFVPLAVHNNRPGADRALLERFHEPAWNNPVVRFVNADGRDWIARQEGVWSTGALATRMADALSAAGRDVPAWLSLVVEEENAGGAESVIYPTYCFWEGEGRFGAVPGVLETRAGFSSGGESVEVTYDRDQVDRKALAAEADALGDGRPRAATEFREAPTPDQKYYLANSRYASLPLTPLQAVRVNAALRDGGDPAKWLSPRQRAAVK